jgi:hypothetical protein
VCCRPIFNIITRVGRISRSTRIVQSLAPSSHLLQAPSSPSHRWVVCTIATNVAQRELLRVTEPAQLFRRGRCALQLGRSNTLAPKIQAVCSTHSLWPTFSSTDEISSVVIFACQPFLRPKRIFEQRQAALTASGDRPVCPPLQASRCVAANWRFGPWTVMLSRRTSPPQSSYPHHLAA